jgi:hypothetical protein
LILVSVVALSAQNVAKCRGLQLAVGIVAETAGDPQLRGRLPMQLLAAFISQVR